MRLLFVALVALSLGACTARIPSNVELGADYSETYFSDKTIEYNISNFAAFAAELPVSTFLITGGDRYHVRNYENGKKITEPHKIADPIYEIQTLLSSKIAEKYGLNSTKFEKSDESQTTSSTNYSNVKLYKMLPKNAIQRERPKNKTTEEFLNSFDKDLVMNLNTVWWSGSFEYLGTEFNIDYMAQFRLLDRNKGVVISADRCEVEGAISSFEKAKTDPSEMIELNRKIVESCVEQILEKI